MQRYVRRSAKCSRVICCLTSGGRHASITQTLKKQATQFGIEVVDVRIGRTDLPETTSQAVYNRMRSDRIAEAASCGRRVLKSKLRSKQRQIKTGPL